jgi:hypothetical protein
MPVAPLSPDVLRSRGLGVGLEFETTSELARGSRLGGGIVAVDDCTPAGTRAVGAARRLAPEDRPPAIVCTSDGGDLALLDPIGRLGPALVVLPTVASAAHGGVVERLLAAGVAVLLVR